MSGSVFVDTGVFLAAAVAHDAHHSSATEVLSGQDARFLTTDVVLSELWAVALRRLNWHSAEEIVRPLLDQRVEIESVGRGDLLRAIEIGEEYPDQAFPLVDRTSFAVMLRLGIHTVATFDHHFAVYRFGPGRRRSFEIAR